MCTGTIISCFPSHGTHYKAESDPKLYDLYKSLEPYLPPNPCETVWDLYTVIVEQAITHLHGQWNRTVLDYIEIYRWVTSKMVKVKLTPDNNQY
jgi:hypothetical protein